MLTIAIPTFNRASHLEHLLQRLCAETRGLAGISVLVSDNCSTDATADIVAPFVRDHGVRYVRNDENIGVDRNIAQAFHLAQTDHVWVCGDDDAPLPGALAAILVALAASNPDLLFMPSIWRPEIRNTKGEAITDTGYAVVDALSFARQVNVWVTYISGMVVRRSLYLRQSDEASTNRLVGTNFIQLAWVLGILNRGHTFAIARRPWLLATSGNSGGYAVLETFLHKLVHVVEGELGAGSRLSGAILSRTTLGYLPQLTYNLRFMGTGFDGCAANLAIRAAARTLPGARLLLEPIAAGHKVTAQFILLMTRVASAVQRWMDLLRATAPSSCANVGIDTPGRREP